jgi:hypothetical protein
MRRNPRGGGGGGIVQLALVGGAAWFLFRTPAPGQPSLFAQLTSGIGTGTTPVAGQVTVALGTPVPAGYRVISTTPTAQTMAPISPSAAGGQASGIVGTVTAFFSMLGRLITPASASAATPTPIAISAVGANPALANATAIQDSSGAVVGYWVANADGTTTSWDAAGGNPMTTDPSGAIVVPSVPIPDLTITDLPTTDPISGLPIDLTGSAPLPAYTGDVSPMVVDTGVPLTMDIWASGP